MNDTNLKTGVLASGGAGRTAQPYEPPRLWALGDLHDVLAGGGGSRKDFDPDAEACVASPVFMGGC